jgi:hypothetical protein
MQRSQRAVGEGLAIVPSPLVGPVLVQLIREAKR